MKTFTTHLQTMILMVLFAFATVQKANASAKAGEASVYEGSTVTIALADTYKRTLMQSTGVTYQWYSENNSYATVTSSTRYNATVKGIKATSSCKVYFKCSYFIDGFYRTMDFYYTITVKSTSYLMVDETTELVGVETPEGKAYRRKYLWAFFAKHVKLVYYHYNNGSRASDVAKTFLEHFMGSISTDGYTVYRMFDGEESKVLHIGCWTHCRRLWVDALPSDRTAMDIIDSIGDLFRNEDLFRTMKLSGEQIKEKRLKLTGPILERIHHKVVMMMHDAKIMANELMRKAANYTINQWKSLRNILKDGSAEISNNLCEQRMKPVKLLLKNCMNIGSEAAAENSAFIFSLIESCKLNDIDPQDYLKHLFECVLHGKDCDKKALLPIFLIIHIVVGLWIPIVVIPFYRSSKITFLKEILKWYY